jgi:hypothetical protein
MAEDGALIVTLPVWARDKAVARAQQAAAQARTGFRLGVSA